MYSEFGTVASCPHCGGFHNRGSLLLEVPLYLVKSTSEVCIAGTHAHWWSKIHYGYMEKCAKGS